MLCVSDSVTDCVWRAIPQATERRRIRNQTDATMIVAGGVDGSFFTAKRALP